MCYEVQQSLRLKMAYWLKKKIKYSLRWSIAFQSVGDVITINAITKVQ